MAFDMTKKPGEGKFKSKLVPENIVADAAQHYAVFAEYVELGTHEQKNDKFPDKAPAPEACIGFELTDQTFMRKDKEAGEVETPLLLNRTVPLSAHEKSNCFKFFSAIGACLSEEQIDKLLAAKVSPKDQQGAPKIGEGAADFLALLGANCFLSVTHGKSKREFKDCYPIGTSREESEEGKLQTVPVQSIDWVWNNFTPASVSPTFHPKYGYEKCERHANSKGNRVFIFDAPTKESWESLDIWQKEKIMSALDYKGSAVEALVLSLKSKGDDSEASPAKADSKAKGKGKGATESMDDIPF